MLSALDLLNIAVAMVVVASYGYVAYSAAAIRRTMAAGLYRRQALGVGLIALAFTLIYLTNFLPYNGVIGILAGIVFYAMALVLLYWVDSSIAAARLSDPLVRDTLKWSRLRWVVWIVSVSDIVITIGAAIYFTVGKGSQGAIPTDLGLLFSVLFPLPIYLAAFSGVIVMPIAARRSRDMTLRRNLEWFFIFIAIQLVFQGGVSQLLTSDIATQNLIDGLALLLGLYPLYQSARRLIPLYRFPADLT